MNLLGIDQTEAELRSIKRIFLVAVLIVCGSYVIALLIDVNAHVDLGVTIDETVFEDPFRFTRLVATITTSATEIVIFFASIYRYKVKRKAAPLLLSCAFCFFAAGYFVYWFKMIFKFIEPGTIPVHYLVINDMLGNGIWLLLLPGALFLLFFVFEVFEGGLYSTKNRIAVRVLSVFLIVCFSLIVVSTYNNQFQSLDTDVMDILLYVSFSIGGFTFLYTFLVQAISAFKIVGKTTERVQRMGVVFIGLSGILFTANVLLELLEQVARALDFGSGGFIDQISVIGQFLSLVASITVYVGFIYPSLKGHQA